MKQKKVRFLVGSLLIVGAIGYLITMGISNTSQYFFTVDELLSQKTPYTGAGLKIKGNVVNGWMQLLVALALIAVTSGVCSLLLLPVVYWLRQVPPPRPITVGACVIAVLPLVAILWLVM